MHFGFYDWLTFLALLIVLAAFTAIFVWIITLPGRIAIKRQHPHAEAVKLMGNLGFLGIVPWIHALLWSIHDSVTVDIRRFPEEEREHIRKEIERLGGKVEPAETPAPDAHGDTGSART